MNTQTTDSRLVPLSERVKNLCAQHYADDCRGCPVQRVCHQPVVPLTYDSLAH
jgi:hypothetical protein